ncbi:splicing factor U2af small subunit B-like protein [Tanacetum coccineum]
MNSIVQVGNVYAQFREEEHAQAALQNLSGRFYAGDSYPETREAEAEADPSKHRNHDEPPALGVVDCGSERRSIGVTLNATVRESSAQRRSPGRDQTYVEPWRKRNSDSLREVVLKKAKDRAMEKRKRTAKSAPETATH